MTVRTWILALLLVAALLGLVLTMDAKGAHAQSHPFPQNADAASVHFGFSMMRSGNTDQWEVCDNPQPGAMIQCWRLVEGEVTSVNVPYWADLYNGSGKVPGPLVSAEASAVLRPNWDAMPEDTPTPPTEEPTEEATAEPTEEPTEEATPVPTDYPEVPVGEPLAQWPETAQEAAEAFSAEGMQTISSTEVSACNNGAGDCWHIQFDEVRPVSVPKGALGQIGPNEFFTQEGRWLQSITLWADWPNLPSGTPEPNPSGTPEPDPTLDPVETPDPTTTPTPEPITQNPPLKDFPQTADKAAKSFGVEGERSADPSQWSPCDNWKEGDFVLCWLLVDGEGTNLSIPQGAWFEGWDGKTIPQTDGPETHRDVSKASVRPKWEEMEPWLLYLPLLEE